MQKATLLFFCLLLFQCSGQSGPRASLDPTNFADGLVIHSGILKTNVDTSSAVSKIYVGFDGGPVSRALWIQNPLYIQLPIWKTGSSHTITFLGYSIQGELMMNQTVTVRRGLNTDYNGDGYSDLVVSASNSDIAGSNRGIVYYYQGSDTGIPTTPTGSISNPGSVDSALFGFSMAMAGDVNGDSLGDLIVGAWGDEKAYVFLGTPGGFTSTPVTTLTYPDVDASPLFGYSVSSAGDVNADGYDDVIVSASSSDFTCGDCGAAYIFLGSASGVSSTMHRRLHYPGSAGGNASFGNSVAGGGDVNGDGFSDVVVGAPMDDGGGASRGSAYVYYGSANGIADTVNRSLPHPSTDDNALFGWSVSVSGDYNNDGYAEVAVGAKSADVDLIAADDKGIAYVYSGSTTGTSSSVTTRIPYPNSDAAAFGSWIAHAGDINGDGYADLAIGADQASVGGIDSSGGTWVYYGSASGLPTTSNAALTYTGNDGGGMGARIGNIGDSNGDGYTDLAVGAGSSDITSHNTGYAYVFNGSSSGLSQTGRVDLSYPGADTGAVFGSAVH